MEMEISIFISIFKNTSEKVELIALVRHIEIFSKSGPFQSLGQG